MSAATCQFDLLVKTWSSCSHASRYSQPWCSIGGSADVTCRVVFISLNKRCEAHEKFKYGKWLLIIWGEYVPRASVPLKHTLTTRFSDISVSVHTQPWRSQTSQLPHVQPASLNLASTEWHVFTFPVLSSELKLLHSGEARRARWGTEAVYFYAFLVFVAITGGRQEHTSFRKKFFFFLFFFSGKN